MKTHKIIIKNGKMGFVYDKALDPFLSLGKPVVKRASHVEPVMKDGHVWWVADLSPVGGPVMAPVESRDEALKAEVDWLNSHGLGNTLE